MTLIAVNHVSVGELISIGMEKSISLILSFLQIVGSTVWATKFKFKRKETIVMRKRNYCKPAILLIVLALTILAGVSTVAYAQSNNTQLQDERGIFNPFTLNFILVTQSNPNPVILSEDVRPPIRIPVRPALRSYFRPPLVPSVQ